jgi:hypothetical protein
MTIILLTACCNLVSGAGAQVPTLTGSDGSAATVWLGRERAGWIRLELPATVCQSVKRRTKNAQDTD